MTSHPRIGSLHRYRCENSPVMDLLLWLFSTHKAPVEQFTPVYHVLYFMLPSTSMMNALGLGQATSEPPSKFSFVSWNLDGLDERNLKRRTKAVCKIIYM